MDERWQQVERIFHAARELDGTARAEFLAKACAGNDGLRREVESLLRQADQAGSFLETPAIEVAAGALAKGKKLLDPISPALEAGTMIAHYRLIGKIGAGGMGEVYRARDTKLQRDVALKILPQAMVHDTQRMGRFKREAQVLASLNHPNIAAIHGLEESNGIHSLVMELVEGETLAERISVAPASGRHAAGTAALPPDETFAIARQMTEALEYAHERGVIHRDLKPANVKITPEGTAKVLDFGLAKVLNPQDSTGAMDRDNSPTLTTLATEPGMLLGTPAYMSPEQAKGQRVDRRCDIWAFGCVLYEMLIGRKAFEGESIQDVLVAVLTKEPDWNALPATISPRIQDLIRRCLVKDPKQRLRDIGEARIAIEETLAGDVEEPSRLPREGEAHPYAAGPSRDARPSSDSQMLAALVKRHKKALVGAVTAAVIVIAGSAYLFRPLLPPPTVSNYTQLTHDAIGKTLIGTAGSRVYLSEGAGGATHMSADEGDIGAAQMSVNGGNVVPIPHPPSEQGVWGWVASVSPDGSKLLVVEQKNFGYGDWPLWAVPTLGGPPVRLADIKGSGGEWSPDGQKLVYASGTSLYLANADGTAFRKLTDLPGPFAGQPYQGPLLTWSPGGQEIAFTVQDPETLVPHLWELSSEGRGLHRMFPGWHEGTGECCGSWVPDGKYFVFQSQGQIWAAREAGSFLHRSSRKPVQLTAGAVSYSYPVPGKDGKKLYAVAGFMRGELERYDARRKAFEPFLGAISAEGVSFSKDGQWVAYVSYPGGVLWRSKLDGSDKLQLSSPPLYAVLPRWSPDGREIVFHSLQRDEPSRIYAVPAAGGSPKELVPSGSGPQLDPQWSPDGTSMVFGGPGGGPTAITAIHVLDLKTRHVSLIPGSKGLFSPRWSPDGRYLVAVPADGSRLMLFDFKARKWTTLLKGTVGWPCWSHNGQYVYFLYYRPGVEIERIRIPDGKAEQVARLGDSRWRASMATGLISRRTTRRRCSKTPAPRKIVSMDWVVP